MTGLSAIESNNTNPAATGAIGQSYAAPAQSSGTMGFDDFLDMINPLEHIPIVSSIYRAVTGDTINPVARIAGDALYGGVFGLAAAGVSALGAAADEAFASLNDGKSASSTVVAALFGSDSDNSIQLAAKDATPAATAAPAQPVQFAALQTPARQSPILSSPDLSPTTAAQSTAATPTIAANSGDVSTAALSGLGAAGAGLPLDRSKQPYGGVMDTAMMQNALQNQTLALALAGGKEALQSQHAIRNNRFATTVASPVTAPTAQSASLSLPGDATNFSVSNATNAALAPSQKIAAAQAQASSAAQALGSALPQTAIPQAVGGRSSIASGELKAIKGLDQYRSTAQRMPVMGGSVDVTN